MDHQPKNTSADDLGNRFEGLSKGRRIRVRGQVQGVGFRPTVWRLARECGLVGYVLNDGGGVLVKVWGEEEPISDFIRQLQNETPPLAHIDHVESCAFAEPANCSDFQIRQSEQGPVSTAIAPDAALCPHCLADITDPENRRFGYAFTNCTHCGPRLSIIHTIPYDRANTAMSAFPMCDDCQSEYDDPADRRFHAQPNACRVCGPRVWLEDRQGRSVGAPADPDPVAYAARLIREGFIVAIKGIGGFHLACDATSEKAVHRLRQRKQRYHKPFALMARDIPIISHYVKTDENDRALLEDRAAPIVLLERRGDGAPLAESIAPQQNTLGFMLPYTPLHHLLMAGFDGPMVMTSGNLSEEPQCTANDRARAKLAAIADYLLLHDRDIVNRLDDSVVRVSGGRTRLLRRARGFAPAPLKLPDTFAAAPAVLAMGGELKNTFCLIREGQAILSPHIGDLDDAATHADYRHNLALFKQLFAFEPDMIGVDMHPGYHSTQWGTRLAAETGLPLVEVQHHHAHIAASMAEYEVPMDRNVLGIALDGLGMGENGELWGGEFLLAGYHDYERLAHFAPVALPGGERAMREPWRNSFAHLAAALGWEQVSARYPDVPIVRFLREKPLSPLQSMLARGVNSPLASSAGRLFDAVAAAIGICREGIGYEGQAAMELEALARRCDLKRAGEYGPAPVPDSQTPLVLCWRGLWRGILDDLERQREPAMIAARFHNSLAGAIVRTALWCVAQRGPDTVVLTGGVFQNRLLLEAVSEGLAGEGLYVLVPALVPANDGGVSLGQAVIAAARTQGMRQGGMS
jgi:hydrogenase maturation protein HypF